MDTILQLKILLRGTKPPIWRRVLVKKTITFEALHDVIQIAMGWTNSHLHEFAVNGTRIGQPLDEFDLSYGEDLLDESTVILGSVLDKVKQQINYSYDFGDSWEHSIMVEKLHPDDTTMFYPACIGGKLNCPPEDCGGIPGFYELQAILADKRHPDRREMVAWLGGPYDSQAFDQEKVNRQLSRLSR